MIRLQTPLKTFTTAAVLLDQEGGIYLLDADGDYAPSTLNLNNYSDGGLRNVLIYSPEGAEPLAASHDGKEPRLIGTQQLGFRPWTNPPGFEMYRSGDEDVTGKGTGVALLHSGAWHTASDAESEELIIASADFFRLFAGMRPTIATAVLGPRTRLSALASRAT